MATEYEEKKPKDELAEIRERYKTAAEYWAEDRKAARDDLKFRSGDQWPQDIKATRESDHRPCLTVDKLAQYVRQIVNDGRQNRPSIKVRPVDSGADIKTAEVFQGLIRHIEDRSNADAAYDTALDCAATCGVGFFKVETEYVSDTSADQEIVIRRVRNPLSILIDPMAQQADGSDMRYAFETEVMTKEDFEAEYAGKSTDAMEGDDQNWYGDDVRICRYWCVKEEKRKLYLLTNGTTMQQDEYDAMLKDAPDLAAMVKTVRDVPKRTVWHAKVTGREYLEEPQQWPGKYIPIMVVWGNELDIEGKVVHSGIYRPAKDAQRLYNYSRSAYAERVALTPKAPWVAAEGQVEDYADDWDTANVKSHSVLRYRPQSFGGTLAPAPSRTSAADIPAGFAEDMRLSEHDIQAAIGMYNASLGAPSNERSGKAIMARQKEGDVGTFHYHDNLNRGIRYGGRVVVDLIPKTYDSTRVIRILGYDGKPEQVKIDPTQETAVQKTGAETIYNLNVGTYDVAISSGPSYNTLRAEAAESMTQMVQAQPELMAIIGDLLVKNMDWPGAEEISARLKLMLPKEIKDAEQNKDVPPEIQAALAQFDQAVQQKDMMIQQASDHIESLMAQIANLKEANELKEKEIIIKGVVAATGTYEAETKRLTAMEPAMSAEQIQQIVIQTLADLARPDAVPMEQAEQVPEQPDMGMPEQATANAMPQMADMQPMEQQQ